MPMPMPRPEPLKGSVDDAVTPAHLLDEDDVERLVRANKEDEDEDEEEVGGGPT